MKRIMGLLSLFLVALYLLFPPHLPSVEDWYEEGLSSLQSHRYGDAIRAFSKAIEMNLHLADAYNNRGFAWYEKGAYERAIADYTKALDINPRCVDAYNNLAWALAVCPDPAYRNGAKAVAVAQKAVELAPEAYTLDTLAAAYAEAGKFPDAVATLKRVITLESKKGETEELAEYREHLRCYTANKPWREKHIGPEGIDERFPRVVTIRVPIGRVREGPSLDSRVKFRLKKGQYVSIIERKGEWLLIELADGRTGWAHQSLFSKSY
jgi:tetratricopeptide (TPR) repeat protein